MDPQQNRQSLCRFALLNQPAGAFRHEEQQDQKQESGHYSRSEHKAPAGDNVPCLIPCSRNKVGKQHAAENGGNGCHLRHGYQSAAVFGRGNFGIVHGTEGAVDADGHTLQHAQGDERNQSVR
ncbi:hypothetical protein D3C75_1053030 [compost metagenome]